MSGYGLDERRNLDASVVRRTDKHPLRSFLAHFRLRHPAQFVVAAFAGGIVVGTALLSLPFATESGASAPFVTALFTATSAVCVTGLNVVDPAGFWSGLGETIILVLIQFGGFGFMTLASLLALAVYRNLGIRARIIAQAETKSLDLGDVRRVVVTVAIVSAAFELLAATLLTVRFATAYGAGLPRAAYLGIFHAVSAFNNAGFSLYPDNLTRFATDGWVLGVVAAAFMIGGIGFPVLIEVRRNWHRPARWSLHTKLTLLVTAALVVAGAGLVLVFEWSNPATLGHLSTPEKALNGFFHGVTPRTAGFNATDIGAMNETTQLLTMVLMFIGGGSAGTAGGVKVTTLALLAVMVWAEARGEPTVDVMDKRIPGPAQRQALAVVVAGFFVVIVATFVLMATADLTATPALFEAFSAFGTVGLSTGITPGLPETGKLVLVALMFVGRVGPITLGAALALTERHRRFRYPEERPIVG